MYEVNGLVALGPRDAGTPGSKKSADYLVKRLSDLGVTVTLETFTHPTPRGPVVFHNVVGVRKGREPGVILLGSHYDTKSGLSTNFVGANDSGSSSGLLLELARVLTETPGMPAAEIRFLFFDGEEAWQAYGPMDGFHGSRYYADTLVQSRQHTNVLGMILMDMVGDKDLTVTLPRNSSQPLLLSALRAAHDEKARQHFELFPYEMGDDHEPFLKAGIPAIDLIDFRFGSAAALNDYWHTPQDTMDKLSAESLQIVGRVVVRMVNDLLAQASAAATPAP